MILHPRTLEVLRPLGVTDALLAHAVPSTAVRVHLGPRTIEARLDTFGLATSRFPHPVLVRQSDVEAVLAQALAARRVPVDRGVELVGFAPDADQVTVELRGASPATASCRYLAGCDGAVSTVRRLADIEWAGGVYRSEVVLADVDLRGAVEPVARLVPTTAGLVFLFPLGEQAAWRLLATRPVTEPAAEPGQFGPALTAADLQTLLTSADLPVQIDSVAWSSRIRLPHRLAAAFRSGRVFLVGDAAHAHSPAGGQGMNTGLQDAVNLGWKVAYASRSGAPEHCPLLASYEQECRPVAQRVRALTRVLFWAEAGTSPLPSLVRGRVAPLAAGPLGEVVRRRRPGAAGVWLLAQFWVRYRASPLSSDTRPRRRGRPRAGDRLPDEAVAVSGRGIRLHGLLASPGLHVLLDGDAERVEQVLADPDPGLHRLTSWPGHGITVIRPDGYIGFRAATVDLRQVRAWMDLARGGTFVPVGEPSRMPDS
jgi:2-polyprenyl-6-methoxyphenol hydroxylase-like FAD-dependent oxidoreductase